MRLQNLFLASVFLLTGLVMSAPVSAKTSIIAKTAHLEGDGKRIKFVAELSKKVRIKVFTLARPYRVIIDMPEVKFQFRPGLGRKGKGLVSAYRYGLFARGKSRIVIDAKKPVTVENATVLPARDGQPAKLIIELAKTSKKIFTLNLSRRYLMKDFEEKNRAALTASVPAPAPAPALKIPSPAPKLARKEDVPDIMGRKKDRSNDGGDDNRPMIVIDPGHGGLDPGALGARKSLEKNIVLKFSRVLRDSLLKTGRFRVALTRDSDIYIPLHDRVKIGRKKGADLFISIHADSVSRRRRRRNRVRGASIYVLSRRSSNAEARALAAQENRSDIIAGVELPESENKVTDILIDLAQRDTNNMSAFFARLQLKNMRAKVRTHANKVHSAGFRVLKAPDVPSVLIELGYLSSVYDERNLKSDKWRHKMAGSIVKSVRAFFNQQVARSPF